MHTFKTSIVAAAGAWLSLVAIPASAAPPAAPVVTTGADIKQLQFDWQVVPQSNYYELWNKADNGSPWVKFFQNLPSNPHNVNNISAHLLDWDQSRYQVKACNPSGCSASPDLAVHDRMLESIGYFKPSQPFAYAEFGTIAAISEDGQTIAALQAEPVSTFVSQVAVYVYARIDGAWREQTRFVPQNSNTGLHNRGQMYPQAQSVSLSADGNVLVVGMPFYSPSSQARATTTIYRRSAATWSLEQQFTSSVASPPSGGEAGYFANMNEAGDRIAFRRWYNKPIELLERTSAGWRVHAAIAQPPVEWSCSDAQLSKDGRTLAQACSTSGTPRSSRLFLSHAPDWTITATIDIPLPPDFVVRYVDLDASGTTLAATLNFTGDLGSDQDPSASTLVFKNVGGAWQQFATLRAGTWNPQRSGWTFGNSTALSRGGAWLAIMNPLDSGAGVGVLSPPLTAGGAETGATYIYDLRGPTARLRRVLKPNRAGSPGGAPVGQLSFANDGKTLLLGEPYNTSKAAGIDGDRSDTSMFRAGALWLY